MENIEAIIQLILLLINALLPFILGFVGIFVVAFNYPSHLFDERELKELGDSYSLKPLMNIIDSKTQINQPLLYPLLGKYNGFRGGHKYKSCNIYFSGSCDDDKDKKNIYCRSSSANYEYDDSDYTALDKSTCVDYPGIPETNYTDYKGKYLYSKKFDNMTYRTLLTKSGYFKK